MEMYKETEGESEGEPQRSPLPPLPVDKPVPLGLVNRVNGIAARFALEESA